MSEHIVSPKIYVAIFLTLMAGTAITVWAAYQNFGAFNIVIALGIATFKATLVVLYFMHARYSPRRTQLVIVCSVFWLAIMLALTLADYQTRERTVGRLAPPGDFQSRPDVRKSSAQSTAPEAPVMNKHTFAVFGILQSGFWGRSAKVIGGSGEPAQPSIP